MVVKDKRGRRRYIAFSVASARLPSPEDLLAALRAACASPSDRVPKLIQFDGRVGIVRCLESERQATLDLLSRAGDRDPALSIRTVSTSGTLRALRERLPER